MVANRRRGEEAIPSNFKDLLTMDQIDGLRKLESFGWSLLYVRRPKFEPVEIVLIHSDGKSHAVLGLTGELEQESTVRVRGDGEIAEVNAPAFNEALALVDNEAPSLVTDSAPIADPQPGKEPLPAASDRPPPKYLV